MLDRSGRAGGPPRGLRGPGANGRQRQMCQLAQITPPKVRELAPTAGSPGRRADSTPVSGGMCNRFMGLIDKANAGREPGQLFMVARSLFPGAVVGYGGPQRGDPLDATMCRLPPRVGGPAGVRPLALSRHGPGAPGQPGGRPGRNGDPGVSVSSSRGRHLSRAVAGGRDGLAIQRPAPGWGASRRALTRFQPRSHDGAWHRHNRLRRAWQGLAIG